MSIECILPIALIVTIVVFMLGYLGYLGNLWWQINKLQKELDKGMSETIDGEDKITEKQ